MQQVNLYQPILRKQEKVFSAKTLLQGNLIVLLGLLLLFGYTALQTGKMSEQVEQVQRQRDEQTAQLADLARQFPPKEKDAALPGRIVDLDNDMEIRTPYFELDYKTFEERQLEKQLEEHQATIEASKQALTAQQIVLERKVFA